MFGIDKILDIIKLAVPSLVDFVKVFFNKKKYTSEEIHTKAEGELKSLSDWRDAAKKEREETLGN